MRKRNKRTKKAAKKAKTRGKSQKKTGTLQKLQSELDAVLRDALTRRRRRLRVLPRRRELKIAQVEFDGHTYILRRLRPPPSDALTSRQREIARLVARGLSNSEVAEKLQIRTPTVAAHLRRIYQEIGVKSRTELGMHMRTYYG